MTQPHVDLPPILLIKEYHDSIMSFLYNYKLEEFLLLICNFNMTLAVSGMLEAGAKCQYIRTLACREAMYQFDSLSADVESVENLNVDYIIRVLVQYFPPVNSVSR